MAHILITKIPNNGRGWCNGCNGYHNITRYLKIGDQGFELCAKCVARLKQQLDK